MKICFFFSDIDRAEYTAQAGIALRLARKAAGNGAEVSVISNRATNIHLDAGNLSYYVFKGTGTAQTYFLNLPAILQILRRIKPDIVHVHGALFNVFMWGINKIFGATQVASVCEILDMHPAFLRKTITFCLSRSERVIVTAQCIKNQLVADGMPPGKIKVARLGLKNEFLEKPKSAQYENDILFWGDAKKERGFDLIYALAQKLPQLKFKVLLRWTEPDCTQDLANLRHLKNVETLFFPYKKPLKTFISNSKIIVLPFRWMGVRPPLSLVEAMAMGKCVVTSSMPGNEELIRHGINGFMIDFEDIEYVESLLNRLIKTPALYGEIGQQAKSYMQEMYSEDQYNAILTEYQKLL